MRNIGCLYNIAHTPVQMHGVLGVLNNNKTSQRRKEHRWSCKATMEPRINPAQSRQKTCPRTNADFHAYGGAQSCLGLQITGGPNLHMSCWGLQITGGPNLYMTIPDMLYGCFVKVFSIYRNSDKFSTCLGCSSNSHEPVLGVRGVPQSDAVTAGLGKASL